MRWLTVIWQSARIGALIVWAEIYMTQSKEAKILVDVFIHIPVVHKTCLRFMKFRFTKNGYADFPLKIKIAPNDSVPFWTILFVVVYARSIYIVFLHSDR